jgi:membrane protein YdbS with pleckstrin-like domain
MIFENQEIPVSSLPHAGEATLQRLPAEALTVRNLGNAIWTGVFALSSLIFLMPLLPEGQKLWMIAVFAGIAALAFATRRLIRLRFEREGFALRAHDIIHQRGYWWMTNTAVPFARVQHVEIAQGPVAKRFGLCTLRVYTAGGGSGDLSIAGIALEDAHRIKAFITEKAGADEAA